VLETDRGASRRFWLVTAGSYLVVALGFLWPVLRAGVLHHSVWIEGDASFPVWANGWVAHAMAHLQDPFYSPDVWAPRGVNLLANTTATGLAVLCTPVTWLFGPVASFNLQLVLVPVVSGVAMCVAVRPWVRSTPTVWLAGLAWGFCPTALESLVWGWTNFLYLATAPLVFWLLSDLLRFRRHHPRTVGLALGAVLTVQLTIGAEMLAMVMVVTSVVLVVTVLAWAATHRDAVRERVRPLLVAAAWCALVVAGALVPLAAFITAGPAHLPDWVYPEQLLSLARIRWTNLVSGPQAGGALHAGWMPRYVSHSYFGVALLVVVAAVVVLRRREAVTWVLLLAGSVSLWLSFGAGANLHPWALLWRLPVVHNIIVSRFVELTYFPAIFLAVLGLDLVITWAGRWRTPTRALVAGLVAVAAFGQLAYESTRSTFVVADAVVNDPALSIVASATPHARFVTYPYPLSSRGMVQQASSSFDYELVGGWGPEPREDRGVASDVVGYFTRLSWLGHVQLTTNQLDQVAAQFRRWRVTDVISPWEFSYPMNRGYRQPSWFIGTMTEIYGPPTTVAGEWVWALSHTTATDATLRPGQWHHCVVRVFARHPHALPACVTHALGSSAG
jgi:hypothetical protein